MQVRVVLFGNLERLAPAGSSGRITLEVDEGASAGDVLDALAVPSEERTYLVVGSERISLEQPLGDGDELRVIVPLGGG